MNIIHVIELSSIVNLETKIHLIDKNDPDKTLLNIPYSELQLLRSGWQKYHNRVFYNGNTYWLHPKYLKQVGDKYNNTNTLGIRISNDFQDKFEVDTAFLKQIPRNEHITVILEESVELKIRNHVIDEISKTLKNKGYNIFHFTTIKPKLERGLATSDLLLGYLTGYKITGEEFTEHEATRFDKVQYYDDSAQMLDYLEDINNVFEDRYENSEDDIKKELYDSLLHSKQSYYIALMQLLKNKTNPIKKSAIQLGLHKKFEHLKKYKDFNLSK